MKRTAALHGLVTSRRLAGLALLATGVILLLCPGPPAQGAVGKDGQIHACYRVKGKPKGALRVVRSGKVRCRRGERKAAWSMTGAGGSVSQGGQGAQGPAGSNGSAADEAALKAQIGALSLRVEALEGVLQGITNGDLVGMLGVLQGLTNEGLTNAVDSVPATEALCEQSEQLTDQVNLVADVVGGLGLNGILTGLGGLLVIPTLPAALAPFSCPSS